jgi:MerR family transcriptional regulator, light-induced transcriptional regulator
MSSSQTVAAELLEASAQGYAAAANALFLGLSVGVAADTSNAAAWKLHLVQRILELAAAVRVGEPALLARRITWLRRAALARGADESDLRRAVACLTTALKQELPEDLHAAVTPALAAGNAAFDAPLLADASTLDATRPSDRLALQYLAKCLEGATRDAIRIVLAAVERGMPAATVYTEVLLPAQKEVGELWHVGDVSIAEEHLVSETTRDLMALLVARYAPLEDDGRCLVAAAVAGNSHDLGLRAATDLFRLAGWRCLFLGANLPDAEIARAAATFDAHLVLLNATLTTQLKPLGDTIDTIRALAPGRQVLVGGLAFEGTTDLWRKLGADALAATIEQAVARGEALVPRPRR